jgi:YegS/Rv2252/BmrU family lipid kinase
MGFDGETAILILYLKMRKRIAFIINPRSGINSKKDLPSLIEKTLDKNLYEASVFYTQRAGHATEISKDLLTKGFDVIVAVGGDGTVNEIAKILIHSNAALGIIPGGSGNGLARHLDISLDAEKAIRILNENYSIQMDTASMNNSPFFVTSGVGFDAHIGHQFSKRKKRGFGTYVRVTLSEFLFYKSKSYQISAPFGELETKAFLVTIGNTAQYGNNAFICPYADVQDGLLDISIIRPFPKIFALDLGRRLFNRTINRSRYATTFTSASIRIEREEEGPVHIDGEPVMMGKELDIKINPASLKVMVMRK